MSKLINLILVEAKNAIDTNPEYAEELIEQIDRLRTQGDSQQKFAHKFTNFLNVFDEMKRELQEWKKMSTDGTPDRYKKELEDQMIMFKNELQNMKFK
jgi:hypothetical protein